MPPADAPPGLLDGAGAAGLDEACTAWRAWLSVPDADLRNVEVADRYFGLSQLPEDQREIGATVRRRPGSGQRWFDQGRAIGERQVQNLIHRALRDAAAGPPPGPPRSTPRHVPLWQDPCPELGSGADGPGFRILLRAWAQAPHQAHPAVAALLLYEQEHGLRPDAPPVGSRVERRRRRHLAWSVLEVARRRAAPAVPQPPLGLAWEMAAGPGLIAFGEELAGIDGEGLTAIDYLLALPARAISDEVLDAGVQVARLLVHARQPAAPEVVGLLRQILARVRRSPGPATTSKVAVLQAILAGHHRDGRGVAAAELAQATRLSQLAAGPGHPVVISDLLRTSQETAELLVQLGRPGEAMEQVREMRRHLDRFGDPEAEEEPAGWLSELLRTRASTERRLAEHSADPTRWLRMALDHAERAADLGLIAGRVPQIWGYQASLLSIAIRLDVAHGMEGARRDRVVERAGVSLTALDGRWADAAPGVVDEGRVLRLHHHLLCWRLALMAGDAHTVAMLRQAVRAIVGPWVLPRELDVIHSLDLASSGTAAGPDGARHDRFALRPAVGRSAGPALWG